MAYIYKITDIRNGVSYVGQHNGRKRSYFASGIIASQIVKKYGKGGTSKILQREIVVEGNFNETLLNELEKHYIRLFATKHPHGYNLTDGGHHVVPSYRRPPGPFPAKYKRVAQYSIEGDLVTIFDAVRLASQITGVSESHIGAVARGSRPIAGGFFWRYVPKDGVPLGKISVLGFDRSINQYSLDGKYIKTWYSQSVVCEVLNLEYSQLCHAINGRGKYKQCGGFMWRHARGSTANILPYSTNKGINQFTKQRIGAVSV